MPDHHPNNLIMKATLHLGLLFTLEGPWYGAYLYVLSHIIFQPLIDKVKTWTYPQYPLTLEVDSGNHDEDPDDMGDPTNIVKDEVPRMRRSTRIPDFAQIQHLFLDDDIIGYRFLMLAENKKHPTPAQLHDPEAVHYLFIKALKQVTQQASHAFRYSPVGARFKEIDTIGAIVGIGSLWTYVEFERSNIELTFDDRPLSQQSYSPSNESASSSDSSIESYSYLPALNNLYEDHTNYLILGTENSNEALRIVRLRMMELAARPLDSQ